jgi:hypothetical protein
MAHCRISRCRQCKAHRDRQGLQGLRERLDRKDLRAEGPHALFTAIPENQKVSRHPLLEDFTFRQIEPPLVTRSLRSVQELETLDGEVGQDYEVAHQVALKSEITLLSLESTQ